MEGTWRVEIRDLSEKQRKEFRSAVLNYEAAPPTKESGALSSSPSNISPTSSSTSLANNNNNAGGPSGSSLSSRAAALFQRQQKPKAPADINSPQKKSMAESFSVYDHEFYSSLFFFFYNKQLSWSTAEDSI